MTEQSTPPVSRKALVSFVLGLLAVPLQAIAGLPAIALGVTGLREINFSEGRSSGRWMCVVGIAMGIFVVVLDLLALGAYAILKARRTNALYACQNNLRQIGLAVAAYHFDHEFFPPGTVPNAELVPDQRLSWLVSLLPYYIEMEASSRKVRRQDTSFFDVYSNIDLARSWDGTANRDATARPLGQFICPSHPAFTEELSPGPTYYVGIAGNGANAAELPLENRNCGFFGFDRTIAARDVTRGLSNTMIACETAWRNGPWAQGGFATARGLDPKDLPYTGPGRPFGGLHPGVTNILRADATVQAFDDRGSPTVFAAGATIKVEATEEPQP
jgi:hypothetical protein